MFVLLAGLLLLSGFFSGSETALFSHNTARARSQAREGDFLAKVLVRVFRRPDHAIGVILVGNNIVNILASALATLIAIEYFQNRDVAIAVATVAMTLAVLVFSELTPKTIAAYRADRIARLVALPLLLFMVILKPIIIVLTSLVNVILMPFGVRGGELQRSITIKDMKQIVLDSSHVVGPHQEMMLALLDLDRIRVEHVMTTRDKIQGLDIDAPDLEAALQEVSQGSHSYVPVFDAGTLDEVDGVLEASSAAKLLAMDHAAVAQDIRDALLPTFFVPAHGHLYALLSEFRKRRNHLGVVVDEFGGVRGVVTIYDIVEQIIGRLSQTSHEEDIRHLRSGVFECSGAASVREINRLTGWDLPVDHSSTVNGLITSVLRSIPRAPLSLLITGIAITVQETGEMSVPRAELRKVASPERSLLGA